MSPARASSQSIGALVQREILRARCAEAVLSTIHRHSRILDGVNALTALQQLSRFKAGISDKSQLRADSRFLAITSIISKSVCRYTSRDLASAMSALAGLRSCEVGEEPWLGLVDSLTRLIKADREDERVVSGRDVAQAFSAMAVAKCRQPSAFEAAYDPRIILSFDARSAASISWAMATCRFSPAAGYLQCFSKHSLQNLGLHCFEDRDLANLAWSMAHMDLDYSAKVVEQVLMEALKRESLGFQALSNIAWACAKAQVGNMVSLNDLATRSMNSIKEAKPQALTLFVWALASLRLLSPTIAKDIISEAKLSKMPACSN